jgi:adenylate kinase family enzyme
MVEISNANTFLFVFLLFHPIGGDLLKSNFHLVPPRCRNHQNLFLMKKIIIFCGLPGVGKSTQIDLLAHTMGATAMHLGKLVKGLTGELAESAQKVRAQGGLVEGLDEMFLDEVHVSQSKTVILDGFPRSVKQVDVLQQYATKYGWELTLVRIDWPEGTNWKDQSMSRQNSRARSKGPEIVVSDYKDLFEGKIERAMRCDIPAAAKLEEIGVTTIRLDATKSVGETSRELHVALGYDIWSLDWDHNVIAKLSKVAHDLGIEAYLSSGGCYRPFWNGRFGPVQASNDKDIFVLDQDDVPALYYALVKAHPEIRWSVHSRAHASQKHFGAVTTNLREGIINAPLNFRQVGIRYDENGELDFFAGFGIVADLFDGVIRLDEDVLAQMSHEKAEEYTTGAVYRVAKKLDEYPALRIEGILAERYAKVLGSFEPSTITTDWVAIQDEVWEEEEGVDAKWQWNPDGFSEKENALLHDVIKFYRNVEKKASAPVRFPQGDLPFQLAKIRELKLKGELFPGSLSEAELAEITATIKPPYGYASWFHYMAMEANDSMFREWYMNQTRSRKPYGGKDPYVALVREHMMQKDNFYVLKKGRKFEQKPTHLGWRLYLHHDEATLQLITDEVMKVLGFLGWSERKRKNVRFAARLAMLNHDIGKQHNTASPGAHEAIGAKTFARLLPEWINDEVKKLAAWMIKTHDLFGRMARAITEKVEFDSFMDVGFDPTAMPSYKGLDPTGVRKELLEGGFDLATATLLHKMIWTADVASVSALRWVLPIADTLEELVLCSEDDVPERWRKQMQLRYSQSISLAEEIANVYPIVSNSFELTRMEHVQLFAKLCMAYRGGIAPPPEQVVAAIRAFPRTLKWGDTLPIRKGLRKFANVVGGFCKKTWVSISDRNEMPRIVETDLCNGHYLLRLFTKQHFVDNSDILDHCLGHQSLDRYHAKSRSGRLQIFTVLRHKDETPVSTIIYDGEKKAIIQVKQEHDGLLDGSELHFAATLQAVQHLVSKPMFGPSGKYEILRVDQILDLEQMCLDKPFAILRSGEVVSIDEVLSVKPEKILGGSMVKVTGEMNLSDLAKLVQRLSVNMTNATDAQRASLAHIYCSLIDRRHDVDGYTNLVQVDGQVVCVGEGVVCFEELTRTGRGVYIKNAKAVYINKVVHIRGRLDVRSAKVLGADSVEVVAGNLQGSCLLTVCLPSLRNLGWHLTAPIAKTICCPVLSDHGGEIQVNNEFQVILPD